jgi:AcrR family transcriptional regulator
MDSPTGDVSTREICERAGIQAPTLYRQFGDKESLLAQVVDRAFEVYLASKRDRVTDADPRQTLRDGWDSHAAWAQANPAFYWIMFSPRAGHSEAAAEAMVLLRRDLEVLAAQGGLRVAPDAAAQMIMAANVGVSLMLISRPALYPDPQLSSRVRDSIHATVFAPLVASPGDADESAGTVESGLGTASATLIALLAQDASAGATSLSTAERAMLLEWLGRLA